MTLVRAHCGVLRGRAARDQVRSGGRRRVVRRRKIARFAGLRSIGNVVYV